MSRRADLWTLYDRHPVVTGCAVFLVTALAMAGLPRLWFTDDYREIFRTKGPAFALFEEIDEQFGRDDQEMVLLARGEFTRRPHIESLAVLTEDLASVPGVDTVDSPTSVSGLLGLLAGAEEASMRNRLLTAVRGHPLLVGHLVNRQLDAAILVVRLAGGVQTLDEVEEVLHGFESPQRRARASGLEVELTGLPLLRSEIVRSAQRDQIVFTAVGLAFGVLVLFIALRDLRVVALAGSAPVVGTLWTVGGMGWTGEPINVVNNVVPVLVLVIGMTDSVHLVREFQRLRDQGTAQRPAARRAVRRVGPACAVTSLTTFFGFLSLSLADFQVVRRFGLTCAAGLLLSFVAVVLVLPLLAGWTPLGRPSGLRFPRLAPPARRLLVGGERSARWLTIVAFVLLLAGCIVALRLQPDYRYREFLPEGSGSLRGLEAVEESFGGVFPLHLVVNWPEGAPDVEVLTVLEAVEALASDNPLLGSPMSVLTPLRALAGSDLDAADLPAPTVLPASVRRRYWRGDLRRALVTARVPSYGAADLEPHLDELDSRLAMVAAARPGYVLAVSGLQAVSARASLQMIGALIGSLVVASLVIFVTLTAAVRSVRLGIISLVPNLLPLVAIGTYLVATDRPLQFTVVTLLTVVLGIAVDDTVHFLVAYRRVRASGAAVEDAIRETLDTVGVSLMITTGLLLTGFGAVGLSQAPQMALFGWLACLALVVALAADLLLLPALARASSV